MKSGTQEGGGAVYRGVVQLRLGMRGMKPSLLPRKYLRTRWLISGSRGHSRWGPDRRIGNLSHFETIEPRYTRNYATMKNRLNGSGLCAAGRRFHFVPRDLHLLRTAVTHLKSAHPEQNVFGNVCRVIRDPLKVARSEHVMQIRRGVRRIIGNSREQLFEYLVAELIHHVVAFEHLRREVHVLVDQRAEALRYHRAYRGRHRLDLRRNRNFAHPSKRNRAFAQVHREVAHAFQVIINFESRYDQPDIGVGKIALAQHADRMLVDKNFHFVDARLGEKHFAGEPFVAFE